MKKMMKLLAIVTLVFGATFVAPKVYAQDAADAPAAADGMVTPEDGKTEDAAAGGTSFLDVIFGSGTVGIILWFALFGSKVKSNK
jgi:hypothetical protein